MSGYHFFLISGYLDILNTDFFLDTYNKYDKWILGYYGYTVVMATGLSHPGKSREGPGTGRDRTGPRDLEGPVVLWSRD